jgi:hypothetical protein
VTSISDFDVATGRDPAASMMRALRNASAPEALNAKHQSHPRARQSQSLRRLALAARHARRWSIPATWPTVAALERRQRPHTTRDRTE